MKRSLAYLAMAVMMAGSLALAAPAQDRKRTVDVTLSSDVMINETLIRKGDYRVRVDFETGEMSLMDKGKVVATVKGQVVERQTKPRNTAVSLKNTDKGTKLAGLIIQGDTRSLILNDHSTANSNAEEQQ